MRQKLFGTLTATAILAALLAPQAARAHDDPFRWPYPRGGFHGEADLIRALEFLQLVYVGDDPTHFYARRAEALTIRAYQALCQPAARLAAARAIAAIRLYRRTHLSLYLSEAAQWIQRALLAESRCHCPGRFGGPLGPAPAVPAVPSGPSGVVAPVPVPVPVPVAPARASGISIWSSKGSSFWGIRWRF